MTLAAMMPKPATAIGHAAAALPRFHVSSVSDINLAAYAFLLFQLYVSGLLGSLIGPGVFSQHTQDFGPEGSRRAVKPCSRGIRPVYASVREGQRDNKGAYIDSGVSNIFSMVDCEFSVAQVGLCPICHEKTARGGEGKKLWLSMKFSAFQ